MRMVVWGALLGAGLVAVEGSAYRLAQIGTCASGGPYDIRSPCPHRTWLWVAVGGLGLLIAFTGVALLATELPNRTSDRLTSLFWPVGWITTGIVTLIGAYSDEARRGTRTGGIVVCVVFVSLGLLILWLDRRSTTKRTGPAAESRGPPPS
jgi:UDP-N-acetylmuramyl pentapeptide phosphotransferase/UDP-N-acetylglucosamine-1-phosphate transferase